MTIALNSLDFDLRKLGLVRKHVPRDGNSFFRCFADHVLHSQRRHPEIRTRLQLHCEDSDKWVEFDAIFSDEDLVPELLTLAAECFAVRVTVFELHPATGALVHNVYDGPDETERSRGVSVAVYPFENRLQFDLVLTEDQLLVDACAQALAYEALYEGVFSMGRETIKITLEEMLCDKRFVRLKHQRKHLSYRSDPDAPLPPELSSLPPVPYRIAKALDPSCYRNVEMDLWLQGVKGDTGQRTDDIRSNQLPVGTRCWFMPPHDARSRVICYTASKLQGSHVQVYVPSTRKKVKCEVRNLLVVADRKQGRRSPRRSPDFVRGPGNEDWLHPDPCIINQHPAHHYPQQLILPEHQPFLPTAAAGPFLHLQPHLFAPFFYHSQMMSLVTSYPPHFSGVICSPGPGSGCPVEPRSWSSPCCFLSPPVSDDRNVFQFVSN